MLKNRLEREIENAKRQLAKYEIELKDVESKAIELELKNQQYTQDLALANKQVGEKEKEVDEISQRIRDIRIEHGSSDSRQIKLLEQKVRKMLSEFFQSCKKNKVQSKNNDFASSMSKKIDSKRQNQKSHNHLEEIQEIESNQDLDVSDRNKQNPKPQKEKQLQSAQEATFDFVIKVVNGSQVNDVPIDLTTIQKVSNLRDYLAKTYSIQKEFLFLYDESGNMLLDEMELESSLFPNVFKTIKNYTPKLTIEVRRSKSSKNKDNKSEMMETLITNNDEGNPNENGLKIGVPKKKKKSSRWAYFIQKLPKFLKSLQHFLENMAILALIVLFIINRYGGDDVINKYKQQIAQSQ